MQKTGKVGVRDEKKERRRGWIGRIDHEVTCDSWDLLTFCFLNKFRDESFECICHICIYMTILSSHVYFALDGIHGKKETWVAAF